MSEYFMGVGTMVVLFLVGVLLKPRLQEKIEWRKLFSVPNIMVVLGLAMIARPVWVIGSVVRRMLQMNPVHLEWWVYALLLGGITLIATSFLMRRVKKGEVKTEKTATTEKISLVGSID